MKKISIIIISALIIFPVLCKASSIQDIYNNIVIKGIDQNEYDINKIINSNDITIVLKNKSTNELYSWSFDRTKIKNGLVLDFKIDFTSKKESEIENLTGSIRKKSISFSHHGTLPSNATVKVYVGDVYNNKEKLFLYYYNEDLKKVEFVEDNIKVENGYAQFRINHCSEYFLTSAIVNNTNGNTNYGKYIIVGLSLIIFILAAFTILFK